MAERVRFELTVELPLHNISNVAPSTTRPSLRLKRSDNIYRGQEKIKPLSYFFSKMNHGPATETGSVISR